MAATVTENLLRGGERVSRGSKKAIITVAETNQLVTGETVLRTVVVANVGTTAELDIYDATSGTSNKVLEWVSADGKLYAEVNIPMKNGLRVITGATPGRYVLTYD